MFGRLLYQPLLQDGLVFDNGAMRTTKDYDSVASGTKDFNGAVSNYAIELTGDITATFSGLSSLYPEILIECEVTSGTPTWTIPATSVIASDSTQTLSSMAAGTYLIWVQRLIKDDTYTESIFVGQVT
jgi:hypothetical protein